MRMKRDIYEIEKEKHRKLMKRLIADGMSFNEFADRVIYMYLEDQYTID